MVLDQGWRDTIDRGFLDPARDTWNGVVAAEVADYNTRLRDTPGYVEVDQRLILAMVWVESGGPLLAAWNQRVMQIGNAGDPGLAAIRAHEGATTMVVRPDLLARIDTATTADFNEPEFNIQTGIAYLFTRMVISEVGSILDPADSTEYEYEVRSGDNASKIAQRVGTTVAQLAASNPGVDIARLSIGQKLKYRKASMGRRITGWRTFDPDTIARQYNVGDPRYADKLRYVLEYLNATR